MPNDDQEQGDNSDGGQDTQDTQDTQETEDTFEFDDERFTKGFPPKRVERK